jgi:hypothetical protein
MRRRRRRRRGVRRGVDIVVVEESSSSVTTVYRECEARVACTVQYSSLIMDDMRLCVLSLESLVVPPLSSISSGLRFFPQYAVPYYFYYLF